MILYKTSTIAHGDMREEKNIVVFIGHAFDRRRYMVVPKLQHGNKVEHIRLHDTTDISLKYYCDGLISSRQDVILGVHNADCFSIFFIDEVKGIFGVAHCGWKGVLHNLPSNMIAGMVKEGSNLSDIKVVIGPGIRVCHFEVKNDVWYKFYSKEGAPMHRKQIDLPMFIKIDLAHMGVERRQIEDQKVCTSCEDKKYYSHRRDKVEEMDNKDAGSVEPAHIKSQISIIGIHE